MNTRNILLIATIALAACAEAQTVIERPIRTSSSSARSVNVSSATVNDDASSSISAGVSSVSTSTVSSVAPAADNPPSVRIAMDFASQAPTGNWDMPYQEACEEASLIIVRHYLEGISLDAAVMDREILDVVAFEEGNGMPPDIDMNDLAVVAREKFGLNAEVVEGAGVTIERIENELAQGNPVIVPLAGQDIGNPYFSGDGPPYHVLVILGYDADGFITHDVGTRRGANYEYDKDVLMSAIHDWTGTKEAIRSGPKRLLIVTK